MSTSLRARLRTVRRSMPSTGQPGSALSSIAPSAITRKGEPSEFGACLEELAAAAVPT